MVHRTFARQWERKGHKRLNWHCTYINQVRKEQCPGIKKAASLAIKLLMKEQLALTLEWLMKIYQTGSKHDLLVYATQVGEWHSLVGIPNLKWCSSLGLKMFSNDHRNRFQVEFYQISMVLCLCIFHDSLGPPLRWCSCPLAGSWLADDVVFDKYCKALCSGKFLILGKVMWDLPNGLEVN